MPRRSNTPPKVDYFEHYRYYHNRGHSTEECNAFEDKIEEFIKLDHLNDFFHKTQSYRLKGRNMPESNHGKDWEHADQSEKRRTWSRSREKEERPLNRPKRVINTIVGGFFGGKATTSARKRHLWQVQSLYMISQHPVPNMSPITFTIDDFKVIDLVQEHLMVISVEITNCIIKKTHVDWPTSCFGKFSNRWKYPSPRSSHMMTPY